VNGFTERQMSEVCAFGCAVKPKDAQPDAGIQIFIRGGNKMKPSTKNEIAGKIREVKGKAKEKVGQLTNDPDLEAEGLGEKIAGKVQKKIGRVEKAIEKP
jgi:uncharacterized protein YjbJ (UPF0337 family)